MESARMCAVGSGAVDIPRLPAGDSAASVGPWRFSASRSRILASACSHPDQHCQPTDDYDSLCQLCRYYKILQFPHMPDMVFPDNILSLEYSKGGRIQFTALDAMKCIDITRLPIQVACAEEWQESRSGTDQKIKPFDWTFITDYKGTLIDGLELTSTLEKINMELLKKREKILFYEDISLYEDELHDHGVASCSVKIRVMPSCWFVLLRYFLRVDDVLSQINDTRMFYELDSPHILVEHTSRNGDLASLKLPPHVVTDPNELAQRLPITSQSLNKIVLPTSR
ncbi:TIP41-like protein [Arctopsyche grandis]|uniref:TIP41-like protein n=1 Tax=Arctopsyche grandis TaxID=121162 RepID=UPI00406D8AE9